VFIQWVAPFISEFPEKTSAFAWARRITRAPVALMNMVSSNINQWGVLLGPPGRDLLLEPWRHVLASVRRVPEARDLPHDRQAFLGWLFLASMSFEAYEAAGLFVLWADPVPRARRCGTRCSSSTAPGIVLEIALFATGRKKITAFSAFAKAWRARA
jgi:cation:H+ antiporter